MNIQTPVRFSCVRVGFGTCGISHAHHSVPLVPLRSPWVLGEPSEAEQAQQGFF